MVKKLMNNFIWKVLSLALAFILWLFVMFYEDPSITREFKDVPVDKSHTKSDKFENKYIEYKEGETVDVVVKGKRSLIDNMTIHDVKASVDLDKTSFTGAIDIELELPDSITLLSQKPTDMMIEYEDIVTVQEKVQWHYNGNVAENYVLLEPIITPTFIEITGPKSQVERVARVVVPITVEGEKKTVTLLGKPQIFGNDNKVISKVKANVDEVKVVVPIEKVKKVPIIFRAEDTVPEGYVLTNVELSANSVMVTGKDEAVDNISKIIIDTISLEKITDSSSINVLLDDLIPNNLTIYDGIREITVNLTVERIQEKTISILPEHITVKNLPEGLQFSYVDEKEQDIVLSGVKKDLDKMTIDSMNPNISLQGLEEGVHELTVDYHVPSGVKDNTQSFTVTILLKREVESEDNNNEQSEDNTEEQNTEDSKNNIEGIN